MQLNDARLGIAAPPVPRPLAPHLPPALHFTTVELAPTDRFGSGLVGTTTAGCAWFDPAAARQAAVGEAAEWYCGSLVPDTLRYASYDELDGAAVDPATLTLYRADQYAARGFPFVPFTHDLPVGWRRGTDLDSGAAVWVPASLVHLGYGAGPSSGTPLTNLPVNAGIAAGVDVNAARRAALREVIERDALATAWHTGAALPQIELPARWRGLLEGPQRALRARLHRVPDRFGAVVLLAVLDDQHTGVLGVGAAMRPDPVEAALKALAEAAMSVAVAADLAAEDSTILPRLQAPRGLLRPWRPDRGYRDAYRPDLRDVTDIACHVQWYLDPRSQRALHDRLDAAGTGAALDALPATADADELRRAAGMPGIAVDLTTADVAATGLRVVRVVVPGTRSTAPAALPFLGGLADPVLTDPVPHA
jgi:ribosomal protein S12 methylthiotransferase accessory factor